MYMYIRETKYKQWLWIQYLQGNQIKQGDGIWMSFLDAGIVASNLPTVMISYA